MYFETLIKTLLTFFLLVLFGFFIKKINLVSDKTVDELSDVLLKIILPSSIIASGFEGKNSDIKSVWLSLVIISICYVFFFVFSLLITYTIQFYVRAGCRPARQSFFPNIY